MSDDLSDAEAYERHWAPVLRPTALRLLERIDGRLGAAPASVLDLGTGTGTLCLAALRRWPTADVTAVDVSAEMAEAVHGSAGRLPSSERDRLRIVTASAAELPFDDATFDAVVSSFMVQLVTDRGLAFREVRRVLRPGGAFAYVAWLTDDRPFAPDRVVDEAFVELGIDAGDRSGGPPDIASPRAAARELRDAGFDDVRATSEVLEHPFTPESYLRFVAEFDEVDLFEDLATTRRERLERRLLERLGALPADALVLRTNVVVAIARRPAEAPERQT